MIINKVDKIEQKYLDLIKLIDSGEYRVASGEIEGFSNWVDLYTFETKSNEGILTSLIYNNNLRFQIAFLNDLNEEEVQSVYHIIKDILTKEKKNCDIWIYNENHNLVRILMEKFNLTRKQVYMSREMMYFKEPVKLNILPLKTIGYSEDILLDTLHLLEAAFVKIAAPNDFLNQRDHYHQKFSNTDKSRFTGFMLNNELIGMSFHHDGEIEYIGVKPAYQRRGYGKLIIHHVLQAIKEDSENIPYLYCVDENEEALQFYLKEGFEVVAHAARL